MKNIFYIAIVGLVICLTACSPSKGDRRGHEFMPDMVHTTGYEANLYDFYEYNRWGTEAEYKTYVNPRMTVHGTVPRGHISVAAAGDEWARMAAMESFNGIENGSIAMHANGRVPYPYQDTEEERLRATREIIRNPFPITESGLARGKALYDVYCGICHGLKGDGQGYLVREEDPSKGITAGVYPAAPANFLLDTFVNSSVGRLYHGIMFGKNVMGSYADKLSYEERWQVIHYIRALQATDKKLEYTPTNNTFRQEAITWEQYAAAAKTHVSETAMDTIVAIEHAIQHEQGNQH